MRLIRSAERRQKEVPCRTQIAGRRMQNSECRTRNAG